MERTRSWFGRRRRRKARGEGGGGGGEEGEGQKVVVDGSEIRELVEDREAFGMFAESKFRELDADGDGRLSVRELQPAVEGIGAALGLPARGSSPNADHIYSEVQNAGKFFVVLPGEKKNRSECCAGQPPDTSFEKNRLVLLSR
ncbi:Os03g0250000 [Oryza sativa Japonica Group]|jgi:hypothetical protein|uniref:Os03g0250000 protein n=1 Tax=Oryza sativa subsp. japonica TaxID=39947 RepID=C7IZQ1_ORYSJ|nr:Os03g0250000 [Oryza sativa Japonica Group]|eukprot:NP_001173350.1 Os03g0250000 [Oryza sativa Japonica Group]